LKFIATLSVGLLLSAYILGVFVAPQSSTVWLFGVLSAQRADLAWAFHAQTLLLALGIGLMGGVILRLLANVLDAVMTSLVSWALVGTISLVSMAARKMVFQYAPQMRDEAKTSGRTPTDPL
jgi:hypothetical protein